MLSGPIPGLPGIEMQAAVHVFGVDTSQGDQLTGNDVLYGKAFEDAIAYGSYRALRTGCGGEQSAKRAGKRRIGVVCGEALIDPVGSRRSPVLFRRQW